MAKNAISIIIIIICILSIFLASFIIHKLNQQEASLLQLKSSLETIKSTYTSIMEKSIFDINDQDIAKFENINLQLAEIADSLEKHKNQEWIPALKNELLTFMSSLKPYLEKLQRSATLFMKELIQALKIQLVNFISNLKPHIDFLTTKISEVSLMSINTSVTIVEKFQRSATPFIKESYNSAIQMSTSLLFGIVKGLNDFFHFCLEAARQFWTH